MAVVKLTARNIMTLRPHPKGRISYKDSALRGFELRVSASGARTYAVTYWDAKGGPTGQGTLKRFTIGDPSVISLADARDQARRVLSEAAIGRDPQGHKSADRARARIKSQAGNVEALATRFLEDGRSLKTKKPWRRKTREEFERIFKVEIIPAFGKIKPSALTKADIRAWAERLAERAPTMANRALGVLRLMYSWAERRDLVEAVPSFPERPAPDVKRERVLTEDELRAVWAALEADSKDGEGTDSDRKILSESFRLMLATAQRRGEVLSMRWQDLTREGGAWWWTIPGEYTKNGRAHRVPLSKLALRSLDRLRDKTGDGTWVFPSPTGAGPMMNPQKAAERLWIGAGLKGTARVHDLRRTAASSMASLGVARFTIARVLNHADRDVTATYDRHAYDLEKRQALEVWGRRLDRIVTGGNRAADVIRLQREREQAQ